MNATANRRHDLDALRAVAMLLGIVLHASLAFFDAPWPVQDTQKNAGLGIVFGLLHGFRMPVFFVISGLFTAMLWRKRGLTSLLRHRVRRVLLPFILGLFTVIPVTYWSYSVVSQLPAPPQGITGTSQSSVPKERWRLNLWTAAKTGHVEALKHYLSNGVGANSRDPSFGVTPLSWTALGGKVEIVEILIEAGADVNAKNRDGATPLHAAAFMGQLEVAQLLLENGADVGAKTHNGDTPLDSAQTNWSDTQAIAGYLQISLDWKDVKAGRVQVVELLQEQEIQRSDSDEVKTKGTDSIGAWVWYFLTTGELLTHLWFLWYLCWFVVVFALYTTIADRVGLVRRFQRVILPWSRYLWLIPLTMLPQWFMGNSGELPHFGPDLSANILPKPHMLLYYAIFFFFGALYYDCNDDAGKVGKRWVFTLPVALLIVFPIGLVFGCSPFPSAPDHIISVVAQAMFAWMMVFSLMGAFRQLVVKGSTVWRYVSDSSYWLYLAHLPLIVLAQGLIRPWQLPALLKFSLLCIVTTAVLLVAYEYLVRYTPIGTLLNGPRHRPQKVAG